jgi:glutathione S-transferase
MMRFFYSQGSCSLASHIALEEAGADYEIVRVSTRDGDQRRPEYLAVNPKGRVPALVTDQGLLTENVAILAWVAQAFPEARLAPADPWGFAQAQAFNSYLASTVHVAHAHRHRGYRWADQESSFADMTAKVPQSVGDGFQLIETELFKGPWVLGEAYSICDGYLFTLADWLEGDGVDPARFPKVLEHRERVRARPAVARALAAIEAGEAARR